MIANRAPIGILLAGLLAAATAQAQRVQAPLDQSRWNSVKGAAACHLVHDIPRFGTVVLSQAIDDRLSTTVLTRRPPSAPRQGEALAEAPAWKPSARITLFDTVADPERSAIRLGDDATANVYDALEAGRYVRFRFTRWQAGPMEVALSPVGFRPALRRHLQCLDRLRRAATVRGDGGAGDTSATVPGETAQPQTAGGEPMTMPVAANAGQPVSDMREMSRSAPNASASGATASAITTAAAEPASDGVAEFPKSADFTVHFVFNNAGLDKVDLDELRQAAEAIQAHPFWSRIVISGYADARGTSSYNRHLALLRAIEVRNHLISMGVDAHRLTVRTFGESQPVADNDSEYGRARNRRVRIRALL